MKKEAKGDGTSRMQNRHEGKRTSESASPEAEGKDCERSGERNCETSGKQTPRSGPSLLRRELQGGGCDASCKRKRPTGE